MHKLSEEGLTREQAIVKGREHFKGKPQFSSLLEMNMDKKSNELKWLVNVEAIYENF